jgi:hypothetical protein
MEEEPAFVPKLKMVNKARNTADITAANLDFDAMLSGPFPHSSVVYKFSYHHRDNSNSESVSEAVAIKRVNENDGRGQELYENEKDVLMRMNNARVVDRVVSLMAYDDDSRLLMLRPVGNGGNLREVALKRGKGEWKIDKMIDALLRWSGRSSRFTTSA